VENITPAPSFVFRYPRNNDRWKIAGFVLFISLLDAHDGGLRATMLHDTSLEA
jgi:hypothetical protein